MRVGIVGAGIAGLAAARTLHRREHEAVLFERHQNPGGRVETIALGDYVFDSGATSIAPRGMSLERVMLQELSTEGLVRIESPVYTHEMLRLFPGDAAKNAIERFTYLEGNATLPRRLAQGLDVRYGVEVETIRSCGKGFEIEGEAFDAVILTPPIPQVGALLERMGETRPLAGSRYRACLSVMLGFARAMPPVPYHAFLDPEQRHPLTWLSVESIKSPGRAPEGHTALVAQLSPAYSKRHYESPDEEIFRTVLEYVRRIYGEDWAQPEVSGVKRWRYSQPESYSLFDTVNRPGSRLLLASDGVLGGRVEYAFEVGVRAAGMLLGAAI